MQRFSRVPGVSALLVSIALVIGCAGSEGLPPEGSDAGPEPIAVVPDFSLVDENPNSATFGQQVSPRDHLGHVTAWYFGHVS